MTINKTRMLVTTLYKLYHRGAWPNIRQVLMKTHVPDMAEALSEIGLQEAIEIFRLETDRDRQAQIFSYLEHDRQELLLQSLDLSEAHRIVSLMESDDAADLLGRLPKELSQSILGSMVREDSDDVSGLMAYPEDSAGGLMTSDFLALDKNLTVAQAIRAIQAQEDEDVITFYVYVINEHKQLIGVLSLKHLLLSKPETVLGHIMAKDVITVTVDTPQEEVARLVERYDFLSLPVVGNSNELVGVITVDDVIDVIREEAEEDLLAMGRAGSENTFIGHMKSRFPWMFLAFTGGSICFWIIYSISEIYELQPPVSMLWLVAAFTPVILSLGATSGHQAAAVSVGTVRTGYFDHWDLKKLLGHLLMEVRIALAFGLFFGAIVVYLAQSFFNLSEISFVMGLALVLQIFISVALGALIPISLYRLGKDPAVAAVAIYGVVADVSAVALLFSLTRWFVGS